MPNSVQGQELLKIQALHPLLADKLISTLLQARNEGLLVGVFCGIRSFEKQNTLFMKGRDLNGVVVDKSKVVTNAKGGASFHQFGLSADLVFFDSKGNWTWESNQWNTLGGIGMYFGMEWGGSWKFADMPHFQYTKGISSIHVAKELYDKGGLEEVWKAVV